MKSRCNGRRADVLASGGGCKELEALAGAARQAGARTQNALI